ncbi:nucleoside triphosphate pyrophosphohydrolase [Desertibaculum subflavum]|uniref:nucleoside triphosphate pyrophosphohydrolase n=1 Tax=Desertibaculum subflavum TaxID=2268458 RepID=UPI000E67287F
MTAENTKETADPTAHLLAIMARLRTPEIGCPWDLEQSFATIAPYTIEEAYEVADAIERSDMAALKEELGDLLLQVVFHARMAEEARAFTFADVAAAISAKLIDRHPHVFGGAGATSPEGSIATWEALKAKERAAKGHESALDGIALALPALLRAEKLQARAARTGFDWPSADEVYAKIDEEIGELKAARTDAEREDEAGDLLFAVVNLVRKLKLDPETALRKANAKFERRFRRIERLAEETGRKLPDMTLDDMEALWRRAKAEGG